jgi:hypothetical protein
MPARAEVVIDSTPTYERIAPKVAALVAKKASIEMIARTEGVNWKTVPPGSPPSRAAADPLLEPGRADARVGVSWLEAESRLASASCHLDGPATMILRA